MKKLISSFFVCFLFILSFNFTAMASTTSNKETTDTKEIIDILGRKSNISVPPKRVIIIGAGASRLSFYILGKDAENYLVGIDTNDQKENNRPYYIANKDLIQSLSPVGGGSPKFTPNIEMMVSLNPDFILATPGSEEQSIQKLQDKVDVPVIIIDHDYNAKNGFHFMKDKLTDSLKVIGKIFDKEERANELIDYSFKIEEDLKNRVKNITEQPTTYICGLGYKGPQGFFSTVTNYYNFHLLNIKNVVNDSKEHKLIIDKEKLLSYNPEIMFLDSGYFESRILPEYQKDPNFYESLNAFKNNKVYLLASQDSYGINLANAYLNCYYMGKVLYPEEFKDIDMKEKSKEIYEKFLGVDLTDSENSKYSFIQFDFKTIK